MNSKTGQNKMSNNLELTCIKPLTISRFVFQRNMTLEFSIDDEIVLNKATNIPNSNGWYWVQSVNDNYSYGEDAYGYLIQIEDIENYFE